MTESSARFRSPARAAVSIDSRSFLASAGERTGVAPFGDVAGPAGGGVNGFARAGRRPAVPTRLWPRLAGCAAGSTARPAAAVLDRLEASVSPGAGASPGELDGHGAAGAARVPRVAASASTSSCRGGSATCATRRGVRTTTATSTSGSQFKGSLVRRHLPPMASSGLDPVMGDQSCSTSNREHPSTLAAAQQPLIAVPYSA